MGAASTLIGACAGPSEVELLQREQASTVAPTLNVFAQAVDAGALVAATDWLELGDRVQLRQNGLYASASNTGSGVTRVGSDARVGSVFSGGLVDLRDRAYVGGGVFAPQLSRGNQTTVLGGIHPAPTGVQDLLASIAWPAEAVEDVRLEPGQTVTLEPGSHGALEVKAGATVRLVAGRHFFRSWMIHSQATIEVESECEPVVALVRDGLFFRGRVVEFGGDDPGVGLLVRYEGAQTAHVESPLRADILAPSSELIVGAYTHEGHFFAQRLRIQSGAIVQAPSEFPVSCSEPPAGPGPSPTVTPLGPAPALTSVADLDGFLDWFYRIRKAEVFEAQARWGEVASSAAFANAVIDRFNAAAGARQVGRALMLLSLLGGMDSAVATQFLVNLVASPIPVLRPNPEVEGFNAFEREVAYRGKALGVLVLHGTTGLGHVRSAATSHAVPELRARAIRVLRSTQSTEYLQALRSDLAPDDVIHLDRPDRSDADFEAGLAAFRANYATD